MKIKNILFSFACLLVLFLVVAHPALAEDPIHIDGSFSDWLDKVSVVDSGGPDDERAPSRADITEFRAYADENGLYVLKVWDNTGFTGGQASTSGITFRNFRNNYYRIYTTAQGAPAGVPLSSLDINDCQSDSTCARQIDYCQGTGCTGAQLASNITWEDPYAGRTPADCSGTNCNTLDTAVELFIPWSLLGGDPPEGLYIFLEFGSYPSGPAVAPKDTTGSIAITCQNTAGTFACYPSTPTAITLLRFGISPTSSWIIPFGYITLIGLSIIASVFYLSRKLRKGSTSS